ALVVDGMPGWGSDVGGVLALVPTFGITWMLLGRTKITLRRVVVPAMLAVLVVGTFLAIDLARPPDEQTHLARLVLDARDRGPGVVTDAIGRKLRANAGVFTESPFTFLIPPIFVFFGWLVLRAGGVWSRLRETAPALYTGLIGALLLALVGFAVNDSGVIVIALVLAVMAPSAILMHLDSEEPT
ncbi:MAG: hypothetical protein QOH90_1156, partial [Actinomycetota bacterium]|nr:hypothetical protein [Actinomycetota bacterium]